MDNELKKLSYDELFTMIDREVLVKDLEYGYEDQICIVKKWGYYEDGNFDVMYDTIELDNEDYLFSYDRHGNCLDGEFEVYELKSEWIGDENIRALRCERHIINRQHLCWNIIDDYCFRSKNLYNYANYIIRLGKITNQNFVSIPFNKFIFMLQYKCENVGIKFIITDEYNTSKASFLDKVHFVEIQNVHKFSVLCTNRKEI